MRLGIKFREKFHPFAPSILQEHVGEWFEMEESWPVRSQLFCVFNLASSVYFALLHVPHKDREGLELTGQRPSGKEFRGRHFWLSRLFLCANLFLMSDARRKGAKACR